MTNTRSQRFKEEDCAKKRYWKAKREKESEPNEEKIDKLAFGILLTLRVSSGNHFFVSAITIVQKSTHSVGFQLKFSEQKSRKKKQIEERNSGQKVIGICPFCCNFGVFVVVFNVGVQVTIERANIIKEFQQSNIRRNTNSQLQPHIQNGGGH